MAFWSWSDDLEVLRRDACRCVYCGLDGLSDIRIRRNLGVDHIVPRSKGGTEDLLNKATARPGFRLAFLVYAAGSRQDARRLRPGDEAVTVSEVRRQLLPLLRVEGRPFDGDVERIAGRLNEVCTAATERLLAWSDREREFIDRLSDNGEIVAELIANDAASLASVREQPLLQWKAQNVREFRKRG